ncbi:esterase [Clostridium sp. 19966]|uniref:alpha/beta hydrolase n=1 Tax=Clostridium sp. 19966 TaxID=2768166 RepID=UPI0028DD4E2F|nr:alpha/beta hydrolase-fold protein [Clostridium sp. 19966]MDT8719247.1 esterase [Clostridium sp. 19966]
MKTNLSYSINLPASLEEGKRYPVIYAMHGMGSNEKDILSTLGEIKEEFIIIGIRGNITMGDGYAYFTIKGFGNPNIDSFDEAIDNIEGVISESIEKYPIDSSKRFLLGFSQGAILSMSLALKMGNKLKGIVALSGYIPKHVKEDYEIKDVSELSVFIGHGKFDEVFPLKVGEENYKYFKERNKAGTFNSYPVGHQISLKEKDDFIDWLRNRK